jgi:hypothetical protein
MGTRCADHVTPLYPQKLALTLPTGGGHSVGIVHLWTKATEFRVLYGCKARSVTLRDECWLRVFQNRVLLKIFGSKRDELTGNWRQLHIEGLHNFYSSPNIWVIK